MARRSKGIAGIFFVVAVMQLVAGLTSATAAEPHAKERPLVLLIGDSISIGKCFRLCLPDTL